MEEHWTLSVFKVDGKVRLVMINTQSGLDQINAAVGMKKELSESDLANLESIVRDHNATLEAKPEKRRAT